MCDQKTNETVYRTRTQIFGLMESLMNSPNKPNEEVKECGEGQQIIKYRSSRTQNPSLNENEILDFQKKVIDDDIDREVNVRIRAIKTLEDAS